LGVKKLKKHTKNKPAGLASLVSLAREQQRPPEVQHVSAPERAGRGEQLPGFGPNCAPLLGGSCAFPAIGNPQNRSRRRQYAVQQFVRKHPVSSFVLSRAQMPMWNLAHASLSDFGKIT